jgi:PhoH-like ATPase
VIQLSELYTGFKQFEVATEIIDSVYKGKIECWDKKIALYPNMYLELIDQINPKHTALARVDESLKIESVKSTRASGISPRNREQVFALNALMDDSITVVVLTGLAGSGKTILALAAAMEKMNHGTYTKIILTRPMSEVGKYKLGSLPGDVSDKFGPYLQNYTTNLEQFVGGRKSVPDLLEQGNFEIIPIQLMRGASFNHCLVIVDECQVCNHMEILTLGTRIGEGSKIVLMGDLNQRDDTITKEKTGIYKMMNDKKIKESPLVAAIELQVCERSPTAKLFAEVFEDKT